MKTRQLILIMLTFIAGLASAQYRIVFYNSHRILEQSRQGREIAEAIEAVEKEWRGELERITGELNTATGRADLSFSLVLPVLGFFHPNESLTLA